MSENPIALQSKKWIVEAVVGLMKEKEYLLITVREIAAKAQIDRRTFYRHFECKDDVLRFVIDEISEEYLSNLKSNVQPNTYTIAKIFFDLCLQHSVFLKLLDKNKLMYFLLEKFYSNLPIIHSQVRSAEIEKILGEEMNYFLYFHAGGFWSIVSNWISDDMKKTPDELAALVNRITDRLI